MLVTKAGFKYLGFIDQFLCNVLKKGYSLPINDHKSIYKWSIFQYDINMSFYDSFTEFVKICRG